MNPLRTAARAAQTRPAIPICFGERWFALVHQPKQFVRFPGRGHDNLDDYGAIETARQFINAAKG
jgi:uncharacterized protein